MHAAPAVTWLADGPAPSQSSPGLAGPAHRSRRLLHRALRGDAAAASSLGDVYTAQADTWTDWADSVPDYDVPLRDALARGGLTRCEVALEIGCGTGQGTGLLLPLATHVVALDLSLAMLAHMPVSQIARGGAAVLSRVNADVRRLPLPDASVGLIAGLNAVPDFAEFRRVLTPDGSVVWASSFAEQTPIYLTAAEFAAHWGAPVTAAHAGHGEWVVARKELA